MAELDAPHARWKGKHLARLAADRRRFLPAKAPGTPRERPSATPRYLIIPKSLRPVRTA